MNSHITHSLVRNELFNPVRKENIDTKELVTTLAVEVAQVMIKEFCDPNKVTKDLVSDIGGKFSWKNTTPEEHEAGKGKSSTNDAAESPFGGLSHVLEAHGRLNPENAAAIATSVFNGDFSRSDIDIFALSMCDGFSFTFSYLSSSFLQATAEAPKHSTLVLLPAS